MLKGHFVARYAPRQILRRRLLPQWLTRLNDNHDAADYLRRIGAPTNSVLLDTINAESARLRIDIGLAMTRLDDSAGGTR